MNGNCKSILSVRDVRTALWLALGVLLLTMCIPFDAGAQGGRGSISGLVTDPAGALVNGAKVTALNNATGVTLHTVTNDAGLYSFVSLNPGLHVVTASQPGFESFAQKDVSVTVDQVITANIALRVGNMAETII